MEYSRDSNFNMGIAHLIRIDALLYDLAQNSANEDYPSWHKSLTLISREIFFLFNSNEMEKNNELDNLCVETINKMNRDKTLKDKQDAYNNLVNYELFLKQQLAQRKMLMAFGRDVKSAIADIS